MTEYIQGWQEGREELADVLISLIWELEAEELEAGDFAGELIQEIEYQVTIPSPFDEGEEVDEQD